MSGNIMKILQRTENRLTYYLMTSINNEDNQSIVKIDSFTCT